MKKYGLRLVIAALILAMAGTLFAFPALAETTAGGSPQSQYSMEQALSDNAQLSTIAFSGLAFITGDAGADSFMPPGKVADFFGFQYMRDVDVAGYGHNTQFLSRVANNVLYILDDAQTAKLVALAKEQAPLYVGFAYNRLPILNAFRRNLEGSLPTGSTGLDIDAVAGYTAALYETDASLSYNRAVTVGSIIQSFTDSQKAYLAKMAFNDFNTWPDVGEDDALKKSLTNTEFVAVMTYASELFSWYKGSETADAYFCPERHGTYFGGFFMKDYPAMNNPDYFISTAVTGDKGQEFLKILNDTQRALIEGILPAQKDAMNEIAEIRVAVSAELRKAMTGGAVDKDKVYTLIQRYGYLDGQVSALYASRFAQVNSTLTDAQRAALVALRDLSVTVDGTYLFSTLTKTPVIPNTDFMFGVGAMPSDAGSYAVPSGFGDDIKAGATTPADTATIKVLLNGKPLTLDAAPVIQNGRVLVPCRAVAEALGAAVTWNNTSKTAIIKKATTTITITVGKTTALINGRSVTLDCSARLISGKLFVPVRFLCESLGYHVTWNSTAKTVTIT